jgi:hypothetical protein
MTNIKPKPEMFLLPVGVREVAYAEHQPQYRTLPSLVTPDGRVISQWMPDPNDLELLKNGVPVTLVLHTFHQPLQPIILCVGGLDLRRDGKTSTTPS